MELILISDSKLKVMLTAEDMKQYDINCDRIDYDNGTPAETRRAFWRILDEAKNKTGFDAAGDRVFVQVYPSKTGGCEMFVTKLGIFLDKDTLTDDTQQEAGMNTEYVKYIKTRSIRGKQKPVVYAFDALDCLLMACLRLSKCGYNARSEAYVNSDDKKYYLQLDACAFSEIADPTEYNGILCPEAALLYIREHCACICNRQAVETLSVLA